MFVKIKIKCFSKRKLNVRISKTKIKCATLEFSQTCCILGKSRKNLVKFSKIRKILANFATLCKNSATNSAIFNEKIEIRERGCFGQVLFSPVFDYGFQKPCKGVHYVDLGESFSTSIYLQNLASIPPRTSLFDFFNFNPPLVI